MKTYFRSTLLGVALSLCAMPTLAMNTIQGIGSPLTNVEMSQYRGGFSLPSTSQFINIGISITTSLNGNVFYNSHIANFLIKNGRIELDPATDISQSGVTNVLQIGSGNEFDGITTEEEPATTEPATTEADELIVASTVPDQVNITPDSIPVQTIVGANSSAIMNVIQNSLDNSVLGISTIVDIDAPVSKILQESRSRNRLNDALMMGR
jgi:hypothetical protein